jgi:hypothetical protein
MSDLEKGYVPMRQGFLPAAVRPTNPDRTPSSLGRAPNAPTLNPAELNKALSVMAGEQAFAVDVYPGYNLVTFLNDNPGAWTVVAGVPGSAYFAGDFINGDFSKLYVIDYYANTLYTLDTTTGAVTTIGPSTPRSGETWTGLSGAADGTMYGSTTNISRSTLYTVDISTGAATEVGEITNAPAIIDIAVTPGGQMFGVDIVNDNLVSIDPATGAGTVIGYLGFNANFAQGMDFEETSGTLYLAAYSTQGELRIADPATGNTTLVGAFPGGAEVDSLAFATGGGGDAAWLSENPASGSIPGYWPGSVSKTQDGTTPRSQAGLEIKLDSVSAPDGSVQAGPWQPAGPVELVLDDGSMETSIGIGGTWEFVFLNRFTPDPAVFPLNINDVSVYFPSTGGVNVGDNMELVLYENTSGNVDPANGANFLASFPVTVQALGQWNTYTLPSPVTFNGPGDVLVGVVALEIPGISYYPAAIDTTSSQQRSWAGWWLSSPPPTPPSLPPDDTWGLIDDFGFAGNWMVRASGETVVVGNTQRIDVTFDASQVTQPGTYTGEVKAKTNDPVNQTFTVAATMVVNAPANWGRLSGTVQGLGYCDVNPSFLKDALVSIEGGLSVKTDANGNYLLWLEAGTYNVTVTKDGHSVGTATVTITGGQITTASFDLRLLQPCLTEDPASLVVTLNMGQTATEQLTLNNTGAAVGTFDVKDSDMGFTPAMQDTVLVVAYDTYNSTPMETALTSLGVPYVEVSYSTFDVMPVEDLLGYLAVFYGGAGTQASIDKMVEFLDMGGSLYIADNDLGYAYNYTPFYTEYLQSTYIIDDGGNTLTGSDIMEGLTVNVSTDPYPDGFTVGPEGVQIFTFETGYSGGVKVERNGYKAIYTSWDLYYSTAGENLDVVEHVLGFLGTADAIWLTEDPISGTVAPDNGTQIITATFDAGMVTQPGIYTAEIKIKTNDPINSTFVVPATMNVNGPADWGRIEGVVSSLGYCDQNPELLSEATVEIVGGPTLITDEFGHYSTWLPNGTYTVNVTADGHVAASVTVVIVAQQTTTQNFGLRVIAPCVAVSPTTLEATLAPDTQYTQTLTLVNTGAGDANFKITEMLGSLGLGNIPAANISMDLVPAGSKPNLTTSSPAGVLVAVAPTANPEAVLWDQPLSSVNQNAYVDQDFSDMQTYSSFLADDFVNDVPWDVSVVFVPGNGWNGFASLMNATSLTWAIFADNGGVPNGDPFSGGAVWSVTLPPSDPQVTITTGSGGLPSNATLNLTEPVTVPDGHWWLVFYPTMPFSGGGQYGRQPADTLNGNIGQFINPGGSFGYGSAWQNWTILGVTQQDIAFRLEGEVANVDIPWLSENPTQGTVAADSFANVAVRFDATGLAIGDYFGTLKVKTGDPNNTSVSIPVTLHVEATTAPDVSFTANTVVVGNPTVFENTSFPGLPPTTEYNWDFGDGNTFTAPTADPILHTYATFGTFLVTLEACNVAGCDDYTAEVVVEPLQYFLPLANKN